MNYRGSADQKLRLCQLTIYILPPTVQKEFKKIPLFLAQAYRPARAGLGLTPKSLWAYRPDLLSTLVGLARSIGITDLTNHTQLVLDGNG